MSVYGEIAALSSRYTPEGAEYYYDEGYLRGSLDHAQDKRPETRPEYNDLIPSIYWEDYKKGYLDGYEEFPEF
jgi:thymidylate synthase ThyX